MSKNPLNLALRFLLELTALIVVAAWGYSLTQDATRFILAFLFPVFFATLWGVFAVPDDPSRSGKTVVRIPGAARLVMEIGLFAVATWMLFLLGRSTLGFFFGGAVLLHYLLSWDRIAWLFRQW